MYIQGRHQVERNFFALNQALVLQKAEKVPLA
jgi:hypothetical protein